MTFRLSFALPPLAALAISACNQASEDPESPDEFAERIGGTNSAATHGSPPAAGATPATVMAPAARAAPGPFSPGSATDPKSRNCGAPEVAPFYGRKADAAVRGEVMAAIAPRTNARFLVPGSSINPDAGSDRLNVMLDASGVIRDARCG